MQDDNVRIKPSKASGSVKAPASKSMAHRYLIGSLLSKGSCVVSGIEESGDMKATLACIEALGGITEYDKATKTVKIVSKENFLKDNLILNCNESGSTLRFMIPICLTLGCKVTLTGTEKLLSRPLSVYEDICKNQGLLFEKKANELIVSGVLKTGEYNIPGDISSQFITGLLFALSLLNADSIIKLIPPVESRSYINMTLQVLHDFGIEADWKDELTLLIKGNQKYKQGNYEVEGDYSNAAFLDVFNYIGGSVNTTGLLENSLQGDKVYREHFEALEGKDAIIDITDCPDLGPVLFALAAMKNGAIFTGTRRLKIKESDRAEAMKQELSKCGVNITVEEDTVKVPAGMLNAIENSVKIDSHNDHRIAMAMATVLTVIGGEITGAKSVNKSFPEYFDLIRKLGIEVESWNG